VRTSAAADVGSALRPFNFVGPDCVDLASGDRAGPTQKNLEARPSLRVVAIFSPLGRKGSRAEWPAAIPSLQSLLPLAAEFGRLAAYECIPAAEGLHLTIALTHRLIGAIERMRTAGHSREDILEVLSGVRAIHARSPFIRRLQEWPRGYAGDFETVEYLWRQRNGAPHGQLPYFLEQYALASPIAQQHRNKIDIQAAELLATVSRGRRGEPARILILAAGGCPDLRQAEPALADHPFEVTLLDQDPEALAFSASQLRRVRDRVALVTANVVRGLPHVARQGRFDLVLAGGLFDYLPDRVAVRVLRIARQRLLVTGGRFIFTNIGRGNAYQTWIEYMAEWFLIHRSDREVAQLCASAGFNPEAVGIETDRTGLTLVVTGTAV
jgi:extracellular factor (EF) 3-hydroxypalmitic acid methyl ester biosynthesis protein